MLRKRDKWILIFSLILVMLSVVLVIIALNIEKITVLQTEVMFAKVSIGDHRGIDADPDVLSFGNVTSNSYAQRNITIGNSFDFPVKFEFTSEGNISEYISFPSVVYLDVGESKVVTFSTIFITNEPSGYYTGNIYVKVRKWIK